jgi:hypothetical protein
MTLLATILATITGVLMVAKSFLELRTAAMKYASEKNAEKANEDRDVCLSTKRVESGRSVWPHPVVSLLAVFSFGLTFFAVWLSGPTTISSIFLMVMFFLSIQLVFLHMAFNVAFRLAGDMNGIMSAITEIMHLHTAALGDVATAQKDLSGIVDRTLAIVKSNVDAQQSGNNNPIDRSGGSAAS